jgi:hypothetical protein
MFCCPAIKDNVFIFQLAIFHSHTFKKKNPSRKLVYSLDSYLFVFYLKNTYNTLI